MQELGKFSITIETVKLCIHVFGIANKVGIYFHDFRTVLAILLRIPFTHIFLFKQAVCSA